MSHTHTKKKIGGATICYRKCIGGNLVLETIKRSGGEISGPVPLPTEIEKFTILRAVHKYKDSREQFEMRTHKRLIDIKNPSKETIDALAHLDLPSGVDIEIKTK